eukprot:scaffold220159_cov59-Attheya_sp.AAC.1
MEEATIQISISIPKVEPVDTVDCRREKMARAQYHNNRYRSEATRKPRTLSLGDNPRDRQGYAPPPAARPMNDPTKFEEEKPTVSRRSSSSMANMSRPMKDAPREYERISSRGRLNLPHHQPPLSGTISTGTTGSLSYSNNGQTHDPESIISHQRVEMLRKKRDEAAARYHTRVKESTFASAQEEDRVKPPKAKAKGNQQRFPARCNEGSSNSEHPLTTPTTSAPTQVRRPTQGYVTAAVPPQSNQHRGKTVTGVPAPAALHNVGAHESLVDDESSDSDEYTDYSTSVTGTVDSSFLSFSSGRGLPPNGQSKDVSKQSHIGNSTQFKQETNRLPSIPPRVSFRREDPGTDHRARLPKVCFSHVEIRLYQRILGDNPSSRSGPSVSIDWNYDPSNVLSMSVKEYEKQKVPKKILVMSRWERETLLHSLGYTQHQIAASVKKTIKIQNQRRQTINNLSAAELEESFEKIRRGLKKVTCFTNNDSVNDGKSMYEQWRVNDALNSSLNVDKPKYGRQANLHRRDSV